VLVVGQSNSVIRSGTGSSCGGWIAESKVCQLMANKEAIDLLHYCSMLLAPCSKCWSGSDGRAGLVGGVGA